MDTKKVKVIYRNSAGEIVRDSIEMPVSPLTEKEAAFVEECRKHCGDEAATQLRKNLQSGEYRFLDTSNWSDLPMASEF